MSDQATAPSYLEMSDEEMMKLPPPSAEDFTLAPTEPDDEPEAVVVEEDPPELDDATDPPEEDDEQAAPEPESPFAKADDALDAPAKPAEGGLKEAKPVVEEKSNEPGKPAEAPPQAEIDYKAEYEKVFATFKANGRDIAVKSAEDAIALMQMGANYNKKMAALKPNLTLMKMLEKNNLLDASKINYLIDLDKKNPAAINKLVQESGLDPMDMDATKASEYKPNTYAVDEREMELDTVLEDLKETPSYTRTLEVVGNKWDGASRQVIADTPQLLKVINGHITSGVYDMISAEVDRDRTFGRLNGLTDIEAYRQVGDAIQARGGFSHLGAPVLKTSPPVVIVPTKPSRADEDRLRDKKRAASSTKPTAAKTVDKDFNPLSMSDEEFSKMGSNKFL